MAAAALLFVLLSCGCVHFGAGKMQHTTNRLQVGVYLSGYGLYSRPAPELGDLAERVDAAKEDVSLHFDLSPEDDVGLKVLEACERNALSDDGCDAVMQQVGSRFSGKLSRDAASALSLALFRSLAPRGIGRSHLPLTFTLRLLPEYQGSARALLASMTYSEAFARLFRMRQRDGSGAADASVYDSFAVAAEAAYSSDVFVDIGSWWRWLLSKVCAIPSRCGGPLQHSRAMTCVVNCRLICASSHHNTDSTKWWATPFRPSSITRTLPTSPSSTSPVPTGPGVTRRRHTSLTNSAPMTSAASLR